MSTQEEFDSEWQKSVWDFAIISTQNSDTKFVMNGPIDYRYYLNYGIITIESFNCSSYSKHNDLDSYQYHINNCIQHTCKSMEADTQYFWYCNHQSWQFDHDFYPDSVQFYKHKPDGDATQHTAHSYRPQKEIYEVALLMDNHRKYRKILTGPVVYDSALKQLSFNECSKYIKGDINVLRKYGQCVKKVAADSFFSIFNENTQYGIQFDFGNLNVCKVELWNFKANKKQSWEHYKAEQQEEKYDVILITNQHKRLQYILSNGTMNCLEEVIKFTCFQSYQSGDYAKLNEMAIKIKGFGIENYRLWLEEAGQEGDAHTVTQRASFLGDNLYETIKHKHFRFPDGMKPNKAFFYRFPDLQSKFAWNRYKNEQNGQYQVSLVLDQYENAHFLPMDPAKLLKNIQFNMDSNLQLIHNHHVAENHEEEEEEEEEAKQSAITVRSDTASIFRDMTELDLEQKSKQSVQSEIHPLNLTASASNITEDDYISNLLSPDTMSCHHENSMQTANERKLTPQDLTTTNHKSNATAFSFRNPANSQHIHLRLDAATSMSATETAVSTSTPIQMDQSESSYAAYSLHEVGAVLSPKAIAVADPGLDTVPLTAKKPNSATIKNSKYFNGKVKLPPLNTKAEAKSVKTNDNPPDKEDEKEDEAELSHHTPIPEVWDFYVSHYGFAPKNASQLHKFSRYSPDVETLKYMEAREQFQRRCKAQ